MRFQSLVVLPFIFLQASSLQARVSPRRAVGAARLHLTTTKSLQGVLSRGGEQGASSITKRHLSEDASDWTKKRLHNTAAFRSMTLLTAIAWAGFSSHSPLKLLPAQAVGSLHMLSFGTWFGMVAYTTFVAGITMFKNLPRQVFGRLQAKLFPKYFAISSLALVLQLVSLKSLSALRSATAHNSAKSLGIALIMTLINQFYLEPQSTANMLERYDLEEANEAESDRYKELKASFGKFHGMSSLTNLIALFAGVVHAVYLASALVAV